MLCTDIVLNSCRSCRALSSSRKLRNVMLPVSHIVRGVAENMYPSVANCGQGCLHRKLSTHLYGSLGAVQPDPGVLNRHRNTEACRVNSCCSGFCTGAPGIHRAFALCLILVSPTRKAAHPEYLYATRAGLGSSVIHDSCRG